MYLCIHVYMYECTYVYMYECICMCVCVCVQPPPSYYGLATQGLRLLGMRPMGAGAGPPSGTGTSADLCACLRCVCSRWLQYVYRGSKDEG